MAAPVIFHNPRCSKSRGAMALLEERGIEPEVVRYLDTPPDRATLERILAQLVDPPQKLVRTGDERFEELGLDAADYQTADAVAALLAQHPELMERPVVVYEGRAVIGRPPEKVLDLLA